MPGIVNRRLSDRIFNIAERDPDREFVVDPVFGRFTYGEIADQVERLAFGLRSSGFEAGDSVIIQLPNWTPFLVFHLAITAINGITINLPLAFRERELGNVLRISGAKGLVIPSGYPGRDDFVKITRHVCDETPDVLHVFLVAATGNSATTDMIDYREFMTHAWEEQGGRDYLLASEADPDALTVLSFTSGTTGEQKGAMLSSRVLQEWNMGLAERYGLDERERILACSPFGHAVGLSHALRMCCTLGATLVLQEKWNPAQALDLIEQERCTFMAGATPFLMDLIYHPELNDSRDMSSLRLFICGGASIPEKLLLDALEALPDTFTTPLWGMTECGGATSCPYDAPLEKLYTTDGKACGDMELKVVDEAGNRVAPGERGELMARGSMTALGYFQRPELTAEYFLSDGFFHTGDQAWMDADGYIKITGRIKDLIIRGGVNISPTEIENLLFSHPRVANVAVVGMPDSRLGERVCAFIQPRAADEVLSMEEMQCWLSEQGLAIPKWPERLEMVESLPMTQSGKVQKFRLRELLTAEGENFALESALDQLPWQNEYHRLVNDVRDQSVASKVIGNQARNVGCRLPRNDALYKVRGKARYAGNLYLENMLHGRYVRSTEPHARIISIDTSTAEQLPGVRGVMTARDIPPDRLLVGTHDDDTPILAKDRVRYVGEPIVAIVADTLAAANEACELVEIEYESLPTIFSPEEALTEGAIEIEEGNASNIIIELNHDRGDVDAAFREADIVLEDTFTTEPVDHAFLEAQEGVAYVDDEGILNLLISTQYPYFHHERLARIMGLPMEQIRVAQTTVGAAFGGKIDNTVE
ncbi:MAG: AMP-binding protein [Gammaproteobacteria bacterium]|nr:AMP-binding protein [Gammaproteobacteria bacterium]